MFFLIFLNFIACSDFLGKAGPVVQNMIFVKYNKKSIYLSVYLNLWNTIENINLFCHWEVSYHQEILALLVFGVESQRKTGYTVLATGRELGVLNVHCPGLSTTDWGFGARFKTGIWLGKHLEDVRETKDTSAHVLCRDKYSHWRLTESPLSQRWQVHIFYVETPLEAERWRVRTCIMSRHLHLIPAWS